MTTLSNIYSREKTLFYFRMWNDSDRMGYRDFLGYEIKHNAFIIPPLGRKGSVWYESAELDHVSVLIRERISFDPEMVPRLEKRLEENWPKIAPYIVSGKEIESGDELADYYRHLVAWWSAMNVGFFIPNIEGIAEEVKEYFLARRAESEKYTEEMNKVFIRTWKRLVPRLEDVMFFVTPAEAVSILNGQNRGELLAEVRQRVQGTGEYNETVYPTMGDFEAALRSAGVELERHSVEGITEIKGSPAFKGSAQGKVRVIRGFGDMPDFLEGEVLVTEMTNPEYVPIMKKAAAVVTDEGGLTCHAAIASRELKVPCVVGTRVATKVLKDGDMVEVDADNGVVRKV